MFIYLVIAGAVFSAKTFVKTGGERKECLHQAKAFVVANYEPNLKEKNLKVWRYSGDGYYYQVKWPKKAVNGERFVKVYDSEFKEFVNGAADAGDEQPIFGIFFIVLAVVIVFALVFWENIWDIIDYL